VPVLIVSVNDEIQTPNLQEGIMGVYPNPFKAKGNDAIRLKYFSPQNIPFTFKVYNLKGQLIYTQTFFPEGKVIQEIKWNGRDNKGNLSPNGMYLIEILQGSKSHKSKLIIVK